MNPFGSATFRFGAYLGDMPTLAALRNTPYDASWERGCCYICLSRHAAGDGNGGLYWWMPTSLDDDDDGGTIKPFDKSDQSPGRWKIGIGAAPTAAVEDRTLVLEGTVNDATWGNLALSASYHNEVVARLQGDEASVTAIQNLEASVTGKINDTNASISNEQQVRATADSALASRASALEAQMSTASGSTLFSKIADEASARVNADNAIANRTSTLESQFAGNTGSSILSRISTEESTRANADQALSQRVSVVEASTGGSDIQARVSTVESAVSNLNGRTSAYWAVTGVAGNNRAQLAIHADANGGAGVDIIGDVSISGGLIVNGTIDANKYGNLSIPTAAVQNSAVTTAYQANNGSTYRGNGGQYSIISFTVQMDYDGDLFLWGTAGQSYSSTSGSKPWNLSLWVNGGSYGGVGGGTAVSDSTSVTGRARLGPGSYTVELRWIGDNVITVTAGAASLIVLRTYR